MSPRYYIKHMENIGLIRPIQTGIVSALDLGCGRGGDSKYLESLGYKVIAVDEESYYEKAIIQDIREFTIESDKYSIIICNNVLPFIERESDMRKVFEDIVNGLMKGGAAFVTWYGPHSGFKDRTDMKFYTYDEILALIQEYPLEIMDKTTTEGFTMNGKNEIIYQHSHRFILKKK